MIPKVNFNVPNSPNFTFDNRLVDQGEAWLTSIRTQPDVDRGSHSFKSGFYFEQSRNSEGSGGVGAGPWAGQFTFNTDTNNPFDTNYSYANALLGTFQDYTEIDAFSEVKGKRYISEFYLQDTWKASRRLTSTTACASCGIPPWYRRSRRRSSCPSATIRRRRRASISRRASTTSTSRSIRSPARRCRTSSSARSCRGRAIATTAW